LQSAEGPLEPAVLAVVVNTAAETLLGGLAVEAVAEEEEDEGPLVEVAAAVGATVVDVVE
jgi:hypothetical protein